MEDKSEKELETQTEVSFLFSFTLARWSLLETKAPAEKPDHFGPD